MQLSFCTHSAQRYFYAYYKLFLTVPDCSEERIGVFVWPDTEPETISKQLCYPNTTAVTNLTATRTCMGNGTWEEPNITKCSSG